MAALLPNPKLFSSQFLADYRNNLPYYFSRPALAINSEKPVWASTISSRWWRECSINFASRRRSRAFSTSATFVSDDEKEDREDEEVDGEEFIPLREMTRWLQNKPAGFGEGKRYDTKAEDKILEEIKLDRKHHIEQNGAPRTREKENAASVKKQEKQKGTASYLHLFKKFFTFVCHFLLNFLLSGVI
ncbi:hypothetical protein MA16_Dca027344 [Dendrobium catenatum]|uniref:Uncharacterized protein n=1 Tax=Dendrobium catenatum TaxID=906689 RepID=A0A2I0X6F6_9ASPA|nr:hypothetical protein MA16_Dca027344 [Dendrobium catenatum]